MKFDHMSKSFNSYQSGPGQLIETREQNEITLFVDRIPAEITKVSKSHSLKGCDMT